MDFPSSYKLKSQNQHRNNENVSNKLWKHWENPPGRAGAQKTSEIIFQLTNLGDIQ